MFQNLNFLKSIVKPLGIWNLMIYGLIWNFMIYICSNLIFLSLRHWFQALPKFYCLIFKLYKILLFNLGCNNWIISTSNHIFGKAFGRGFGINYPSAFLKILKFQIFQKSRRWFIPKIARTKHEITSSLHQSNKHLVLKPISFNSRQLQVSEWAITK